MCSNLICYSLAKALEISKAIALVINLLSSATLTLCEMTEHQQWTYKCKIRIVCRSVVSVEARIKVFAKDTNGSDVDIGSGMIVPHPAFLKTGQKADRLSVKYKSGLF